MAIRIEREREQIRHCLRCHSAMRLASAAVHPLFRGLANCRFRCECGEMIETILPLRSRGTNASGTSFL
jgi:hypothetical protein